MTARRAQRAHATAWAGARLVEVTAHLEQGAALDDRWPVTLDAILATAARRRRLGTDYGRVVDHHIDPLGLCLVRPNPWWWAASGATVADPAVKEVHWIHGHVKHLQAEDVTGEHLPPIIRDGASRWRAWRKPIVVTATAALRWRALGDPRAIESLLGEITAVGKKRGTGEGHVTGWEVTDAGAIKQHNSSLLSVVWADDGTITRPVPARHSNLVSAPAGCDTVQWAIRPPYHRPPQTHSEDGGWGRQWRQVIAPWTTREGGGWMERDDDPDGKK